MNKSYCWRLNYLNSLSNETSNLARCAVFNHVLDVPSVLGSGVSIVIAERSSVSIGVQNVVNAKTWVIKDEWRRLRVTVTKLGGTSETIGAAIWKASKALNRMKYIKWTRGESLINITEFFWIFCGPFPTSEDFSIPWGTGYFQVEWAVKPMVLGLIPKNANHISSRWTTFRPTIRSNFAVEKINWKSPSEKLVWSRN